MMRKKNKFFTFCCSLIPGAGEMFLGFFKQGITIMLLFFILTGLGGFLNLTILMVLSPVIWFYSFFHTNHLNTLPDDEFYALEDDYPFSFQTTASTGNMLLTKYRRIFAVLLMILGASVVWNVVNDFIFRFLFRYLLVPDFVRDLLRYVSESIPQAIVGIAIVMSGFVLIKSKKEELDREEKEHMKTLTLEDKESNE